MVDKRRLPRKPRQVLLVGFTRCLGQRCKLALCAYVALRSVKVYRDYLFQEQPAINSSFVGNARMTSGMDERAQLRPPTSGYREQGQSAKPDKLKDCRSHDPKLLQRVNGGGRVFIC